MVSVPPPPRHLSGSIVSLLQDLRELGSGEGRSDGVRRLRGGSDFVAYYWSRELVLERVAGRVHQESGTPVQ